MVIVMEPQITQEQIETVQQQVTAYGYIPHLIQGRTRTVIGAVGDERGKEILQELNCQPGVEQVLPILKPYKLAGREVCPDPQPMELAPGVKVGAGHFATIAGPCAVESEQQIHSSARALQQSGAQMLRGGAFKPRTSPYAFQGLGETGLKLLAEAGQAHGLPVVTEVLNPRDIEVVAQYADMLQVGARNTQNFALLKLLGQLDKPILLKRGMATTVEEFLMSAEYILAEGNPRVVLCERGIRTFEQATRNTLDLAAVAVIQQQSHLPVMVDPSHATGAAALVPAMSCAAVAAGCDGLLIEVHPEPAKALSDGPQSLDPEAFSRLMQQVQAHRHVVQDYA